jgi:hypothetical protein
MDTRCTIVRSTRARIRRSRRASVRCKRCRLSCRRTTRFQRMCLAGYRVSSFLHLNLYAFYLFGGWVKDAFSGRRVTLRWQCTDDLSFLQSLYQSRLSSFALFLTINMSCLHVTPLPPLTTKTNQPPPPTPPPTSPRARSRSSASSKPRP